MITLVLFKPKHPMRKNVGLISLFSRGYADVCLHINLIQERYTESVSLNYLLDRTFDILTVMELRFF